MNEPSSQSVWRFAPSPNGLLHLGHAYSALSNYDAARAAGGRFLLRIEDIDRTRARPEFEQAIFEDLAWLGLRWEEPVRRQSEHFEDYARALERLEGMGIVYPCFCTRADIARAVAGHPDWPRDPDGAPVYPGTCRDLDSPARSQRLTAGLRAVKRLDMEEALGRVDHRLGWREYGRGEEPRDVRAEPWAWGDIVVARRDVPTSYHLSVVVDDAIQGVTDVMRGRDLFAATSIHRLLQALLDLPAPRYHHHPLILDEKGAKMSKSRLSQPLRALRAEGASRADIRRMLGLEVGHAPA